MPKKRGRGRPRKTSVPRTPAKKPLGFLSLRKMVSSVKWTESYTSLLMGVVVVIVSVLFVVSFLRQTHHMQETSSTSTVAPTVSSGQVPTGTQLPSELNSAEKTYTVKAGDDLWHIAENFYKSGYNWVDIARANNLSDPNTIHSGNRLIIPQVTPHVATITAPPKLGTLKSSQAISGTTYTVVSGDTLWDIAVRAYADGYKWVDIARVNNLANPGLIHAGNRFAIPR